MIGTPSRRIPPKKPPMMKITLRTSRNVSTSATVATRPNRRRSKIAEM
jgi:hypothetical protein